MGTPSFAVPILEELIDNYEVVLVVCQPDRKKDRKGNVIIPETKRLAIEHNIDVFQPLKVRDEYQTILDYNPDMIVTCAYGQFIPKEIIEYPKYGCINVHGSLLPKLRGGAPIHWAIINGEKVTGMTVMSMSEKMDAGDIISQRSLEIEEDETLDSLYSRMSILGSELLLDTIPNILDGTAQYSPQEENEVTFGLNVKKEEEKIDFSKSCLEVKNLVRGLCSIPGAYCLMDDKRMKVYKVEIIDKKYVDGEYGEIVDVSDDAMIVRCGDGYIKILDIALEGKKRCMVKEYFNGIKKNILVGRVLK
jgi:methionyl-tRNA formyltransferase